MTASMSCDQFDLLFPLWLEDEIGPSERGMVDQHLATCARCAALAGDVAAIVAGAAALPTLMPEGDLWQGIASRIGSPVASIGGPAAFAGAERGVRVVSISDRVQRWWRPALAAAAAVAVIVAGAASVASRGVAPEQVASVDAPVSKPVGAAIPAPSQTAFVLVPDSVASTLAPSAEPAPGLETRSVRSVPAAGRSTATLASAPARSAAEIVAQAYARDIALLVIMVEQQRAVLDTATIAVLERNFAIIDQAIEESRRALERDPASQALTHQFDDALATKLDLLRRVVLLSSGS